MAQYKVWLCPPDPDLLVRTGDGCSNGENHEPEPPSYLGWHEWARTKSKTHKQQRCPGCGLFRIWVPKPSKGAT